MSAAVAAADEQAEETVTHGAHTIKVAASWRVGIGGKTWSTGALACRHLAAHADRYAALAPKRQLRILELGAGTGFAVGDKITIADVHLYASLTFLGSGFFDGIPADYTKRYVLQ